METRHNNIANFIKVIDMFRKIQPDLQLQTLRVFLTIALSGNNGILHTEMIDDLKMQQASVSRNVRNLAAYDVIDDDGTRIRKGHDLVSSLPDMLEAKKHRCFLTSKGKEVYEKVISTLEAA